MSERWSNWSGNVVTAPRRIAVPESEAELCEVVAEGASRGEVVRAAGTGHSFSALCEADGGTLVSLERMRGVAHADTEAGEAAVWAGTKLWELGEPLRTAGLAMENMGDIDRQAIAGAVSTGTHGTGRELPNLSAQVIGARLVRADGSVVDIDAGTEPETMRAVRVSLGALGVLSQVRLRLLPSYCLHERTWTAETDECLEGLAEHIAGNRHFEFFWDPVKDKCLMKTLNPVPGPPDPLPERRWERVDYSDRIFPSEREVRFNEIEFSLPAERGVACFGALRRLLLDAYAGEVAWPLEYRTVAADDAYLSPASGRATVAISAHQGAELPYERFFHEVEAIFLEHGGRPHWGKVHGLGAGRLAALYPDWARFLEVRARLDPRATFLNRHLRNVFGV